MTFSGIYYGYLISHIPTRTRPLRDKDEVAGATATRDGRSCQTRRRQSSICHRHIRDCHFFRLPPAIYEIHSLLNHTAHSSFFSRLCPLLFPPLHPSIVVSNSHPQPQSPDTPSVRPSKSAPSQTSGRTPLPTYPFPNLRFISPRGARGLYRKLDSLRLLSIPRFTDTCPELRVLPKFSFSFFNFPVNPFAG